MQRHKVTIMKRKSKCNKCNAAGAEMEQATIFQGQGQDRGREKNSQAKDRIFEDKCT